MFDFALSALNVGKKGLFAPSNATFEIGFEMDRASLAEFSFAGQKRTPGNSVKSGQYDRNVGLGGGLAQPKEADGSGGIDARDLPKVDDDIAMTLCAELAHPILHPVTKAIGGAEEKKTVQQDNEDCLIVLAEKLLTPG